jgi:hypothetical protein
LRTVVHVNNQQAVVCAHYYSETAELVVCVWEIALQWERHVDEHTMRDMATSYSAGYDGVAHVGRPRSSNYYNEGTDQTPGIYVFLLDSDSRNAGCFTDYTLSPACIAWIGRLYKRE